MKSLSPFRKRFVKEYLIDFNGARAYRRAGGARKAAAAAASRLLKVVNVQKALAKAQKAQAERLEISADRWLRELQIIGFSDLADYIEINSDTGAIRAKGFKEMKEGKSRALESIQEDRFIREDAKGEQSIVNEKVKFKLHQKIEALKIIGQHLGFLKDEMKHTGDFTFEIIHRGK